MLGRRTARIGATLSFGDGQVNNRSPPQPTLKLRYENVRFPLVNMTGSSAPGPRLLSFCDKGSPSAAFPRPPLTRGGRHPVCSPPGVRLCTGDAYTREDGGEWLTYAQLGSRLRISSAAARQLSPRRDSAS